MTYRKGMNKSVIVYWMIIFIIFLLISFSVEAENPFALKEKRYNLKAGLGVMVRTNIRKHNQAFLRKNDPVVAPLPYLRFKLSRLEVASDKVKWIFAQSLFWETDVRIDYRGHDYEANQMTDRRKSIFGGIALRFLIFKVEWLHDLLNYSTGETFSTMIAVPLLFTKKITIVGQAEIEYWNRLYVNYYFGVRPNEAMTTRPEFNGNKERSYCYQLTTMINISKNLLLRNNLLYRKYGPNIYNSPTVRTSKEYEAVLGLVYEFL